MPLASLCFVLALLCVALLRFASGRLPLVWFASLCFASLFDFCFASPGFASLCVASFCIASLRFALARSKRSPRKQTIFLRMHLASPCFALRLLCFASLRFAIPLLESNTCSTQCVKCDVSHPTSRVQFHQFRVWRAINLRSVSPGVKRTRRSNLRTGSPESVIELS